MKLPVLTMRTVVLAALAAAVGCAGAQTLAKRKPGLWEVQTTTQGQGMGGQPPNMKEMMENVPPHWNVYFNVDDVDASVRQAEELGAKTLAPAMDVPGVGRMAMMADPQGAAFGILEGEQPDE